MRIDLPSSLTKIELLTIADSHIGDKFADVELLKSRIEYVKHSPNAYIILNGDIMNNATKTSISDSYAEQLTPMEEIEMFCQMFEPVKDKIIAITNGNHEARTYNKEGIDLSAIVAKQLGLYDRYSKTSAFIFLRFGHNSKGRKVCYTIYTIHGSGGGRKEGAKAIRLADMASIVDADIYIHSHTHLPMTMKQGFYRADPQNSYVAPVTKLFINTAAYLNYGGYGCAGEFKVPSTDTPIIYLDGVKKKFSAEL